MRGGTQNGSELLDVHLNLLTYDGDVRIRVIGRFSFVVVVRADDVRTLLLRITFSDAPEHFDLDLVSAFRRRAVAGRVIVVLYEPGVVAVRGDLAARLPRQWRVAL